MAAIPAKGERVVRVFLSSTFRDMHAEREELIKRVFPLLRHVCEQRGVVWGEVDLRWGVTEEDVRQGRAVGRCLDEIDRCRPFFLGLLGERYGWVPQAADLAGNPNLATTHPWVTQTVAGRRSVTEMEVAHAVLRDPHSGDGAFFYFRDPNYSAGLPPALRPDFEAEDEEAVRKLTALKDRIRASGRPVRADYPDVATLGRLVLDDFTALLDRRFPPDAVPDPHQRETEAHHAFAAARARGYLADAWAEHPFQVKARWARLEAAAPLQLAHAYRPLLRAPTGFPRAAWVAATSPEAM